MLELAPFQAMRSRQSQRSQWSLIEMDLSRFPRRRYTPFPTPIELLPHFTKALAASCPDAGGNNFMFELMGVEAITVVPGGSDMGAAMSKVAQEVASLGRKGYVIPGGGSNAIGGLGYVACVQEMQQQWFDMGLSFDAVVVGSGSSGTHGGMAAGFWGNNIRIPLIGIGVSRDPADQEPLVLKEAQAVAGLLGTREGPR